MMTLTTTLRPVMQVELGLSIARIAMKQIPTPSPSSSKP
jgi:hypothetical protein